MLYELKVELLKKPRVNYAWRWMKGRRGHIVGSYADIPNLSALTQTALHS